MQRPVAHGHLVPNADAVRQRGPESCCRAGHADARRSNRRSGRRRGEPERPRADPDAQRNDRAPATAGERVSGVRSVSGQGEIVRRD